MGYESRFDQLSRGARDLVTRIQQQEIKEGDELRISLIHRLCLINDGGTNISLVREQTRPNQETTKQIAGSYKELQITGQYGSAGDFIKLGSGQTTIAVPLLEIKKYKKP